MFANKENFPALADGANDPDSLSLDNLEISDPGNLSSLNEACVFGEEFYQQMQDRPDGSDSYFSHDEKQIWSNNFENVELKNGVPPPRLQTANTVPAAVEGQLMCMTNITAIPPLVPIPAAAKEVQPKLTKTTSKEKPSTL